MKTKDDNRDDCGTEYFDPTSEVTITQRSLPHWNQDGKTYFVTFRLADSLPQEKLKQLVEDRKIWEKTHKEPWTRSDISEFHRLFTKTIQDWLDAGSGACILSHPAVNKIVADTLLYFDNQRYKLGEWVIMPNHVHALVTPYPPWTLTDILHSWKSFTAHKINQTTGKTGTIWQHETYDHLVRSETQLKQLEEYIRNNPRR